MKKLLLLALCFSVSICFAEGIDVFKLVEDGIPEQLQQALKSGAGFNIQHNIPDLDNLEVNPDYWPFDSGETPLHRAAAYNHNPESIKFLIGQGLDVNAVASVGNNATLTPLACALFSQNNVAAKELLKAGANPNAWTAGGYDFVGTPFHIVAVEYDDNPSAVKEIVTALINAGGNINNHEEISSEELNKYEPGFVEHRALFLPRSQWDGDDPISNMYFFSHATNGNFLTTFTPLMWAVIYDKPKMADIFLDFNADVNIRSVENKSAIDYADDLPQNSKIKKSSVFKRLNKYLFGTR